MPTCEFVLCQRKLTRRPRGDERAPAPLRGAGGSPPGASHDHLDVRLVAKPPQEKHDKLRVEDCASTRGERTAAAPRKGTRRSPRGRSRSPP